MAIQRNTVQKQLLREALSSLDHPTADEIYQYVHGEYPNVGKATLYRNIKLMYQDGDINKLKPPGMGAARFDHHTHPHFHGLCRLCGKLCDINMNKGDMEKIKSSATNAQGFTIEDQELMFIGLCANCREKMEEQK